MRRFVRHPTDIPIRVTALASFEEGESVGCMMTDVGQGGLACEVTDPMPVGALVEVHIPSVWPEYTGRGEVVWCQSRGNHHEIGIAFTDLSEAYRSRMVQQVCQIEHYKNIVFEREGRILDGNQAAEEWIEKYAEDFPRVADTGR